MNLLFFVLKLFQFFYGFCFKFYCMFKLFKAFHFLILEKADYIFTSHSKSEGYQVSVIKGCVIT